MNLDGKQTNTEHEHLRNVKIPDEVLRMYTTTLDTSDIPSFYVQEMARELLKHRGLAKAVDAHRRVKGI